MLKFSYRRTLIVGFGFLGISIIWPIFNQYVPIFLQAGNPEFNRQLQEAGRDIPQVAGFAIRPALALFIMTWDNILNMLIAPWAGERSDRTWNRFGRRKGWIVLGAPLAVVGFVLIPFAQSALAIAAFILITNFGMALFRSPTVAWLGDLFLPDDRSKANGIINLMGGVGGLLAYFGGGYLFNGVGRAAPFIAGVVLMLAVLAVVLWRVHEPERPGDPAGAGLPGGSVSARGVLANLRAVASAPQKGGLWVLLGILLWFMAFNALETGLSSFAVFTLGMKPGTASIYAGSVTVSFILFAVPAGWLGTRYGRRPVIQIGLIGLTVLSAAGYALVHGALAFVITLVLAGGFWALVNVNSLPLVYDHGDERKIGAYTGLYYFSSQLAAVLGPTLSGVLVEAMGSQYRWLWPFSMVFMALAWLVMTRVRARSTAAAPVAAD